MVIWFIKIKALRERLVLLQFKYKAETTDGNQKVEEEATSTLSSFPFATLLGDLGVASSRETH